MGAAHVLLPADHGLPAFEALRETGASDLVCRVKWFCPWSDWTWYVYAYDPATDCAGALVVGFEIEAGDVYVPELEKLRGPGGLRIERDLYFTPAPLPELREKAEEARR